MHEITIEPRPITKEKPKNSHIDLTHEADLQIETLEAFKSIGLPLHPNLVEMLLETPDHRFIPETYANNRRGSGYMQATRLLGEAFDKPIKQRVYTLFDPKMLLEVKEAALKESEEFKSLDQKQQETLEASWKKQREARLKLEETGKNYRRVKERYTQTMIQQENWKATDRQAADEAEAAQYQDQVTYDDTCYQTETLYDEYFPNGLPKGYTDIKLDAKKIHQAVSSLKQEENVLIGRIIEDLLNPQKNSELPLSKEEKHVGTCTTAETYFAAILDEERGYNPPNTLTDTNGEPIMILKNAGEKSAITLRESTLGGVRIPAGSLISISSRKDWSEIKSLEDCEGFKFLRLTTLAISPKNRTRAFGMAIKFQKMNGIHEPETTTVEELYDYAKGQLIRKNMEIKGK